MEQYSIHLKNTSDNAIQLTFVQSDQTEDTLRLSIEEHGVVVGNVVAHSMTDAKHRIINLIEKS